MVRAGRPRLAEGAVHSRLLGVLSTRHDRVRARIRAAILRFLRYASLAMFHTDNLQPVTPVAYPTQSAAAAMLGVAESTLSRAIRRHGIVVERAGDRNRHVPAGEVVRLNDVFRRKIAEELAGELVAYAETHEASSADSVEAEVTAALERPSVSRPDGDEFLDELRRVLPASWYREAERVYRATVSGPVAMLAVTGVDDDVDAPEAEEPAAPISAAG